MTRLLTPLVAAAALLLLIPLPALAQTAPAPPPAPVVLGPGLVGPPAALFPGPLPLPEKLINGPAKSVDLRAKTVQVGGGPGLSSTTLEVTEDTQIAVEGAPASLQDIREGDLVEAAYEERGDRSIATSIGVTESERRGAEAPPRSAPPAVSPSMGAPQGANAPSRGAPKTP